jgi:hypothetical protein
MTLILNKTLREIWYLALCFWLPIASLSTLGFSLYSYFTTVRDSATETAELLEDMATLCEEEGGQFLLEYNAETLYIYGECDYELDDKLEFYPMAIPEAPWDSDSL